MPTNDEIIKKYDLEGDGDLGIDVHEALKEARADTAKQIDTILEKLEKSADFFYKNATDLANKNYERGLFDGIHTARYKIKETLKTSD